MKESSLGYGSSKEFLAREFGNLDLNDKRLSKRALVILEAMQERQTCCVRRLFIDSREARQAYDFF